MPSNFRLRSEQEFVVQRLHDEFAMLAADFTYGGDLAVFSHHES
jgi:hypothetical protein